ncbi:tyrosine--tRNA ligase [Candidatus Peregrinibacteria bacterium]|jgi:tyrosyl-tRNA synthetase|nr:tyrosine--tRNA ligase [Candidatus Peregrinibacteria bacterium]MBT4631883.1 tyrosine--tRNA ligase [Candidatus Peregrinibacteria bacterium]MBT5516661.1 tyrosine--tRNA ligase [Candidatus Peregrinibacteria bacterium]MBT5824196.1 tyrosine--tRNA ligase [Candidatus Peregrinibacteria bacterium]
MTVKTDEKLVDEVLSLGVSDVIVAEDLKKKLMSGRQLRIKLGIDPTGFDLHLGHMVVIHKLKEFQDMGHQIVLLFGNFTGQIGDPSGKDKTRPMRNQEELENNAKDYLEQVSKILDVDKVEVVWNADWLAKMNFADVAKLASNFTVSQMLERDMYQERIKAGKPIALHEFLYPLMQGYDSVAIKADLELGGTDQTFNLLAARPIQKANEQAPQNVMTVPILVGTDGTMKMGKSTGNYIAVADEPNEMFGKTMSIPDDVLLNYFELAARANRDELDDFEKRLSGDANPRDMKVELAKRIVSLYYDEAAADAAEEYFVNLFKKKAIPDEIEETKLSKSEWGLLDLIVELEMASSKGEARRLVQGGAVKINEEKIDDVELIIKISENKTLIQVGKRKFRRISL